MKLTATLSESARGLAHSKTLAREPVAPLSPEGFGLRQPSAAFHCDLKTRINTDQADANCANESESDSCKFVKFASNILLSGPETRWRVSH